MTLKKREGMQLASMGINASAIPVETQDEVPNDITCTMTPKNSENAFGVDIRTWKSYISKINQKTLD